MTVGVMAAGRHPRCMKMKRLTPDSALGSCVQPQTNPGNFQERQRACRDETFSAHMLWAPRSSITIGGTSETEKSFIRTSSNAVHARQNCMELIRQLAPLGAAKPVTIFRHPPGYGTEGLSGGEGPPVTAMIMPVAAPTPMRMPAITAPLPSHAPAKRQCFESRFSSLT